MERKAKNGRIHAAHIRRCGIWKSGPLAGSMTGLSLLAFSFSPSLIYEFVREFFQGNTLPKKSGDRLPGHRSKSLLKRPVTS
jgi:hypothetical protein